MKPRALAWLLAACVGGSAAQGFEFIALGDMPYGAEATTGPAWRALIQRVNRQQPAFTLHVGDFKDGLSDCSDALYERLHGDFQRFEGALVYTPGDNDWVDCQRTGADPLERLQALRQRFFGNASSLGRRPIAVQRQADLMPEHGRLRENLRWWHEGVLFTTFHTVGPYNNIDFDNAALRQEHAQRESANAAWIQAAFTLAHAQRARALVFATQADMLERADAQGRQRVRKGFEASIVRSLLPLAETSRLPVLLVHGDTHHRIFDQPFRNAAGQVIPRLWRLEVYGDPQMHALRVRVDPAAAQPFQVTTVYNPASPDPRQ
ncbi:MAG: hypothetical protein HY855_25750 [Burkholderiales bacterium]|nr:hypothetical protein [Burkholderiales bacterium]